MAGLRSVFCQARASTFWTKVGCRVAARCVNVFDIRTFRISLLWFISWRFVYRTILGRNWLLSQPNLSETVNVLSLFYRIKHKIRLLFFLNRFTIADFNFFWKAALAERLVCNFGDNLNEPSMTSFDNHVGTDSTGEDFVGKDAKQLTDFICGDSWSLSKVEVAGRYGDDHGWVDLMRFLTTWGWWRPLSSEASKPITSKLNCTLPDRTRLSESRLSPVCVTDNWPLHIASVHWRK